MTPIPKEILSKIILLLPDEADIRSVSLVSKQFRAVVNSLHKEIRLKFPVGLCPCMIPQGNYPHYVKMNQDESCFRWNCDICGNASGRRTGWYFSRRK